jgi:hypothetical protein
MVPRLQINPDPPWAVTGHHLVAAAAQAQRVGDLDTAARLIDAAYAWFEEQDIAEDPEP